MPKWTVAAIVILASLTPGAALRCQETPGSPPGSQSPPGGQSPAHDFAKWEKEVAAYEASDRTSPPQKGAILFIGSSTIRLWTTLAADFPGHKLLNRGFGGTEIVDATHYADRLIFPHEPKQIFLRAGGNDINAGKVPSQVAHDFAEFVRVVRARLPKTEIVFIGLSPAPVRWGQADKNRELNRLVRQMTLELPRVAFVDAFDVSLGPDGQARPDLFAKDRLHFSPEGYRLLANRVRPFLLD
ncbi:GDSL-type esterase/lipase family protein [Aquisphaera insulae]|uniref:GDSL-type esterase/lipase family protein n=1 Tax=Aquisphaera insulae TaxID=2712864 RepID=UPI0013EA9EEE|nr:GDSL-type esterase/lipase family protein [Aquisphaera insulae]